MKKILLTTVLLIQCNYFIAQVKDISFTISPFAEYNWWDNKSGLENGTLVGGKLGFGFGEYIELRAVYAQSIDLKTNFDNYGIPNFNSATFNSRNVKLTRYGGEFKANIGKGSFNPYIKLGTGIQRLELDNNPEKMEQIYTALGIGIKTKLTDRITFTVEGKNTMFNFNSGKNLLTAQDKTNLGVTNANFASNQLYNWSVQGALQFYLGGRKPGTLSELDKAYLSKFRGGFKGLRWVLEPSVNYMNFNEKSNFKDTYLMGAYFGMDFNQFTGVRVYYLQANENGQLSSRFDKLAMYGAEFRARLNDGNGVTPYLIFGGGYLNPSTQYVGVNNSSAEIQKFASGGLGLNIPLSKNILITGGARGIVTSGQDIQNLSNPDQLQIHMMFNAGLKLTFGAKSANPNEMYQSKLDTELTTQKELVTAEFEEKLKLQNEQNQTKLVGLKDKYTQQMDSLQIALTNANKEKDANKAIAILEQKNKVQKALDDVETVSKLSNNNAEAVKSTSKVTEQAVAPSVNKAPVQPKELIKMTPKELEMLIDRILDKTQPQPINKIENNTNQSIEVQQLNQRIDFLEKLILKSQPQPQTQTQPKAAIEKKTEVVKESIQNKKLEGEIEKLKEKSAENADKIQDLGNKTETTTVEVIKAPDSTEIKKKVEIVNKVVEPSENEVVTEKIEIQSGRFIKEEKYSSENALTYKGSSLYAGVGFGNTTMASVGARSYFGIKKTNLDFIPIVYYGFSNPSSWGASGNLIYNFKALKISENMTPYAGAGIGFSNIKSDVKVNYNISFGTNLKILNGRLFSDITLTNLTDNVQIALGYRLPF